MTFKNNRLNTIVSGLLLAQLSLFAGSSYVQAASEKLLIVGRDAHVESLHIANVFNVSVYTADQIYSSRYIVGAEGKPTAWLASSAVSDNYGLVWTFKIRSGVNFLMAKNYVRKMSYLLLNGILKRPVEYRYWRQ